MAVTLPVPELLLVLLGLAPTVRLAVAEALTVLLLLRVLLGVRVPEEVPEGVLLPVGELDEL